MVPHPLSVSDTELEVLKVLWEDGPGTVREIRDALVDDGHDWAYTTVQTLLSRLEQKGGVKSDRRGRAHVFSALVSRDAFVGEQLEDLAERVCDGAAVPLLLSLVRGRRFRKDEIRRFRELLDEMERKRR